MTSPCTLMRTMIHNPWLHIIATLMAPIAFVLTFVDVWALRLPIHDFMYNNFSSKNFVQPECKRMRGPVGAEDGIVYRNGGPPIIFVSELDAVAHECTNLENHGTDASTAPRATLWTLDHLDLEVPRLTALEVPLPDGVTKMLTHGLGLHGDIIFAVNHAYKGGGERIERWRVERLLETEGPPVSLTHIGSITGHDGDADGAGAWAFTTQLNGAINAVAPVDTNEFYMTQWLDAPVSLEGGGTTGTPEGFVPEREPIVTRVFRTVARALNAELFGAVLLPLLRRTRIWHCYCAVEPEGDSCGRWACEAVGPPSTHYNGIAFRPTNAKESDAKSSGYLYVNDIFQRNVVEFSIRGSGRNAQLKKQRTFRFKFLIDNIRLDSKTGAGLWIGGLSPTASMLFDGLGSVQEKASAAHSAARVTGKQTPRPHLHLRPGVNSPPQPAMPSGALHIDLASGVITTRIVQSRYLASVSWSHEVAGRIFMGSPWDDGVLVCRSTGSL